MTVGDVERRIFGIGTIASLMVLIAFGMTGAGLSFGLALITAPRMPRPLAVRPGCSDFPSANRGFAGRLLDRPPRIIETKHAPFAIGLVKLV